MRLRSSGVKSEKKKSENEDEAGKSRNGTEKCEEKFVNDLEKARNALLMGRNQARAKVTSDVMRSRWDRSFAPAIDGSGELVR